MMTDSKRAKATKLGFAGLGMLLGTGFAAVAVAAEEPAPGKPAPTGEPKVNEVVQEALRYFRVHPAAIDSIRSSARTRALLPVIAGGYNYGDDKFKRNETQSPTPLSADENTTRRTNGISVGAVWDFRELVFNPAEVQVYGLVGIQRDIMLEVTRTYYLRRQLLLLRTKPSEDPLAAQTLDLRIEEFTATLDVLTGGWFSRALAGQGRGG